MSANFPIILVIQALQEGKNALLESPTGTGKTLCLLCSTLAWRQSYVEQLKATQAAQGPDYTQDFDVFSQGQGQGQGQLGPKIIYASRTHSQLTQVVKELKRTNYKSMVSSRKCQFHTAVSQFKSNSEFSETICDIEDMVSLGHLHSVCPYYLSKEQQGGASMVFMPYNYLVDPEVRKNLTLSLSDSVLIFDEAHNLEGICGDAASFDLSASDLASCVREVQHAIDTVMRPGYGGSGPSGEPVNADELAQLKTLLLKLEEAIDSAKFEEVGGLGGGGFTRDGPYIYTLLAGIGITFETHLLVVKLIEDTVAMITDEAEGVGIHTAVALSQFNAYLKTLFKIPLNQPDHPSQYYKVHIHTDKNKNQGGIFSGKGNKKVGKEARTLSYWCFNPGVAMQALVQSGVRSVILTSGTLSPMDSFAYELKTPFQVQLENSHVITKGQVWVGVIAKGPSGQPLNSSYQNRDSTTYKSDLGNAIVNYARMVPNGLLVFFPSYSVLTASIDFWKLPTGNSSTTIWERICSHKQPVIEPRESHQFPLAIDDFYQKVKDPGKEGGGAVFFAVCRGKVSEGLDFADHNGRAVIITGLPYPALDDPKIKLKREYLNNSKPTGNTYVLRGGEWYSQQASRAVNQAVGRVIRHRNDYGAIILCDERFGQRGSQDQLSKWLRPHIKVYNQFGESTVALRQFFKNVTNVANTDTSSEEKTSTDTRSIPTPSSNSNTTTTTTTTTSKTTVTSSTDSKPTPGKTSLLTVLSKPNDVFAKAGFKPGATAKPTVKLSEQLKRDSLSKNKDSEESARTSDPKLKDSTTNANNKAPPPVKSTADTAGSEKKLDPKQFNILAKQVFSEANYAKFHSVLRDFKTKRISLDEVVRQVRELANGNETLLEHFVPFIPVKHQEKYRGFLLYGTDPHSGTKSEKEEVVIKDPEATTNVEEKTIKAELSNKTESGTTNNNNHIHSESIEKNPPTTIPITTPPTTSTSTSTTSSEQLPYTDEDAKYVLESPPKRVHQYDLISGQPAKKKVKMAPRPSALNTSKDATEDTTTDNTVIPDPEPKPEGASTGGCVCSICHSRASSPFNARCGHICCHACWMQWLQEKLECPVCREKTRPKQLTKLYFL